MWEMDGAEVGGNLTGVGTLDIQTDYQHDLAGRLRRRTQRTEGMATPDPYVEYQYWASDAVHG